MSGGHISGGELVLVGKILDQIKKQGLFDEIRRQCLLNIDSNDSYKKLKQQTERYVEDFLGRERWHSGLDKKRFRERLRAYTAKQRFIDRGVESILETLVNDDRVDKDFYPQIEALTFKHLGIEIPEKEEKGEEEIDVDEGAELSVLCGEGEEGVLGGEESMDIDNSDADGDDANQYQVLECSEEGEVKVENEVGETFLVRLDGEDIEQSTKIESENNSETPENIEETAILHEGTVDQTTKPELESANHQASNTSLAPPTPEPTNQQSYSITDAALHSDPPNQQLVSGDATNQRIASPSCIQSTNQDEETPCKDERRLSAGDNVIDYGVSKYDVSRNAIYSNTDEEMAGFQNFQGMVSIFSTNMDSVPVIPPPAVEENPEDIEAELRKFLNTESSSAVTIETSRLPEESEGQSRATLEGVQTLGVTVDTENTDDNRRSNLPVDGTSIGTAFGEKSSEETVTLDESSQQISPQSVLIRKQIFDCRSPSSSSEGEVGKGGRLNAIKRKYERIGIGEDMAHPLLSPSLSSSSTAKSDDSFSKQEETTFPAKTEDSNICAKNEDSNVSATTDDSNVPATTEDSDIPAKTEDSSFVADVPVEKRKSNGRLPFKKRGSVKQVLDEVEPDTKSPTVAESATVITPKIEAKDEPEPAIPISTETEPPKEHSVSSANQEDSNDTSHSATSSTGTAQSATSSAGTIQSATRSRKRGGKHQSILAARSKSTEGEGRKKGKHKLVHETSEEREESMTPETESGRPVRRRSTRNKKANCPCCR